MLISIFGAFGINASIGKSAMLIMSILCMIAFPALANKYDEKSFSKDKPRKNVILIAVDDLSDWIGCLGGHPQVKTPNMDKLASRGVLFNNAHCQAPVCNPSRASMMTSLYPSTSGIYFLNPGLGQSKVAKEIPLLPKRYEKDNYIVSGAGKLFHGPGENKQYMPNWAGSFGGFGPHPSKKICSFPGHKLWDWGVFPKNDELMSDYKIAAWGSQQLSKHHEHPFFLGLGFYTPHVPQFAPQKWFDLYPLETLQMPEVLSDDLKDISEYAINITRLKHVAPTMDWVVAHEQWKPLVQSYLACISFVDHQIGKVMHALEESPHKDQTYIILYSDHGFHQGEKDRFAKRSLWADGTRVPMIITGPGIFQGGICNKPVQLLDIYPTLLELTELKADSRLEGHSLAPLLKNPKLPWPYYARCSFGPGNDAIISENYRYIKYHDGSEEFYSIKKDIHEWNNLIQKIEYQGPIKNHRDQLPRKYHPVLGKNSTGHKSFIASESVMNNVK
jgi:arylsulfatase A-like enzyme